jgi:hypothetical protein
MKIFLVAVLLFLSPLFSDNISIPTSLKVQEKLSSQGQRIFRKKLQRRCGYTAAYFAQQHTIKDWKAMGNNESFRSEFNSLCPKG